MTRNLTPKEKRDWILENCIDENGDIDLSNLDFSDFEGNVYTSKMKVKHRLYQYQQRVGNDLYQGYQDVGGNLIQDCQEVEGELCQGRNKAKNTSTKDKQDWILENCVNEDGDIDLRGLNFNDSYRNIYLSGWKVRGNLFQDCHEIMGSLYQNSQWVSGDLKQNDQEVKYGVIIQDEVDD